MAWERPPSHKIDYAYFVRYLFTTTSFHPDKKATKTAPFWEHGPSWPFSIRFSPLEAEFAIFVAPLLERPWCLSYKSPYERLLPLLSSTALIL